MTDTPPDWVLREAARRGEWRSENTPRAALFDEYRNEPLFAALCDMILKHEQPPVDRKLLCAREAATNWEWIKSDDAAVASHVHAITLWEEGFGK